MFEELDFQSTAIGDISLRRRNEPRVDDELVYEVKLGDEFLMTSLVTAGEIALATITLDNIDKDAINVVVGGLGLGYTADAVLRDSRVTQLLIIEALSPVIEWHRRELVPMAPAINRDPRCRLVCGDFFQLALSDTGFDYEQAREFDAILLDIDHSPRHRLTADNDDFYTARNLQRLAAHLTEQGWFAMWSNEPPDNVFLEALSSVFSTARSEVCEFQNPYSGGPSSHTIYLASK